MFLDPSTANVEVEVNYVEHDFAKLDDLSRRMKGSTRAVLYFRGPGIGKTTTLINLCSPRTSLYVPFLSTQGIMHNKLGIPANGAYIFVDEAQCLKDNKTLCVDLVTVLTLHVCVCVCVCVCICVCLFVCLFVCSKSATEPIITKWTHQHSASCVT